MSPPKTHPNNGATMWASIPDNVDSTFPGSAIIVNMQVPAGQQIYVASNKDKLRDGVTADKKKFHADYVETWHARHIPGHSYVIGNCAWEKHPAYSGPADMVVYVYDSRTADQKVAEVERQRLQLAWALRHAPATAPAATAATAAPTATAETPTAVTIVASVTSTTSTTSPGTAPAKKAAKKAAAKKTTTKKEVV